MIRLSAITRISLGVACLTLTALLAAQLLGLLPDAEQAVLDGRRALCEAVAVQCCLAAQREDVATMKVIARALVDRNADVISVAVRRSGAAPVLETDAHRRAWDTAVKGQLPGTHVTVPIYEGRSLWGGVEICFRPLQGRFFFAALRGTARLAIFVSLASFLLCLPYLKRLLRYLDPSSVIPGRVRATLDTLAEGVLILDRNQRIVLANQAFAGKIGRTPRALQGISASQMQWSSPRSAEKPPDFPWLRAIQDGVSQTGVLLGLQGKDKQSRTLAVNAMPILGGHGEKRGVLATFDDISQIEEKNLELERMLIVLKESREQIQRQNKDLYLLATRDPLTQCLNRRSFFEKLEAHWNAAAEQGRPLCFIMADVDHFKSVNDRFGHQSGDTVLCQVAANLHAYARPEDLVCRYGGEEFCILLPGLEMEAAAEQAERYRRAVEVLQFPGFSVSISLGVAGAIPAGKDAHELIEQADKCLYVAKRSGRNRVVRWDQLPPEQAAEPAAPATAETAAGSRDYHCIPFQVVNTLSNALAYRDMLTAEHSRQVAEWCVATARGLLPPKQCYELEVAALLHDIGKIAIPDAILLKPGPLSEDERQIMTAHDQVGGEILAPLGSPELIQTVRLHHLPYGGRPDDPAGPSGQAIPVPARILAICDAFTAMTADRVYRRAMSRSDAFAELRKHAGTQFDPALVERFIGVAASQDENFGRTEKGISKHTALMIGLQIDRLTMALDKHDFGGISLLAGHLAATAAREGVSGIAKLAGDLEHAAVENPELVAIVKLTNELLNECQTAQRACLDARAVDGLHAITARPRP
jgi:diguanylate cyclase (GGDEF)-like protein/PAS domain S-box-containing protein